MHKNIILLLILVFLVVGYAQNLLQNPGFESWSGGMPNFWQKDDSIAIFQEDVFVHSGNFSVKDSLFTQTQTSADFFQGPFAVSPNVEYTFSIWVIDNDLAGRIRQAISWHVGTAWQNVYSPDYATNSPNWQELTLSAISPSGTDSALVFLRAYDSVDVWDGDAIFYLDDAYFAAPSVQPPVIVRFWHTPTNPASGIVEDVYAKVSDDGSIDYDTLFYGVNNLISPTALSHTAVSNDTFKYNIPGQTSGDTVFYYLRFIDNDGLETFSDTHAYYVGSLNIYINEIYYDTPGADSGCFIEIFGPGGASLNGFSLVGINGNGGAEYDTIDLGGNSIPGDGFFVIGDYATVMNVDLIDLGANLQNGPDDLELRFNNITIDALGYGTLDGWVFTGEWLPAPDVEYGHSLGRYPDGDDTDTNLVDFNDYTTPTPGEPNPPVGIFDHENYSYQHLSIMNPIHTGILFASVIQNKMHYPVTVYNALGQVVRNISEPKSKVDLPYGVYFFKLNNVQGCAKVIVVK